RRVAEGVAGRLVPAERRAVAAVRLTRNPDAYEHFLRGNYGLAQRTSTGLARATAEYRQAAALDSGFVSALARVGLAYALRLDWSWDATGGPPAGSLAAPAWQRARALDPGRPITLPAYAQMVVPAEAASLLDSALAVDPGFLLARLSRADARLAQGDTSAARRDLDASRCEGCAADMWP